MIIEDTKQGEITLHTKDNKNIVVIQESSGDKMVTIDILLDGYWFVVGVDKDGKIAKHYKK